MPPNENVKDGDVPLRSTSFISVLIGPLSSRRWSFQNLHVLIIVGVQRSDDVEIHKTLDATAASSKRCVTSTWSTKKHSACRSEVVVVGC